MEEVAGCLSWTPNITSLTIHPAGLRATVVIPTPPIILARLEAFSLTQSHCNEFYASIVAPSLRSLELEPGASDVLHLHQFAEQTRTISYISFAGRVHELSSIYTPVEHFPPMRNVTILRMDVSLNHWRGGDVNPRRLLSLMKQHPHILPSLLEIYTNEVWNEDALDLLWDLQNRSTQSHRLGLSIYYSCDSPATPIPRVELVENLVAAKIVRIFREYY